jgi:ACS family allantoate permease-like MFS transporter
MGFSVLPPLAGFLGMSLLPNDPVHKWTKWGCYFITVPYTIALFLAWTLIPSNTAGRTKRTLTSSFTFVGYCVGNMVGSQIFRTKDAPRYTSGTIGCAVCFGLEILLICSWRIVLIRRNRRKDAKIQNDGLSVQERVRRGKELGELDYTDFENPYVSESLLILNCLVLTARFLVPVYVVNTMNDEGEMRWDDITASTSHLKIIRLVDVF